MLQPSPTLLQPSRKGHPLPVPLGRQEVLCLELPQFHHRTHRLRRWVGAREWLQEVRGRGQRRSKGRAKRMERSLLMSSILFRKRTLRLESPGLLKGESLLSWTVRPFACIRSLLWIFKRVEACKDSSQTLLMLPLPTPSRRPPSLRR